MSSTPPPAFLSMGLSTYRVPKDLFATNRKKVVESLRSNLPPSNLDKYVIFMEGGPALMRNDTDHEPIFRQESYFHYLFGVREPDHAGLLFVGSGKSMLFAPRLPPEYATVMGEIKSNECIQNEYSVNSVCYSDEVEDTLINLCASGSIILVLEGTNSDSGNAYIPPQFKSPDIKVDKIVLFPILAECRVTKSQYELDLIRHCTEITSLAHVFTMKNMKPNMMEYQGESLFKHFAYYNFGARHVGYTSICGCGPNGAVLHYGHAGAPNDRQIQDGDMVLFDMGAEYFCYGSDVTCSFPVSSLCKFTLRQRRIYEGVLNAQREVIRMIKPGVCWVDCHKTAEMEILKVLVDLNIVVPGMSTLEDLVDNRLVGSVFMPHGLGHLIGIDTHDVGGYLPGNRHRIVQPGLKGLRTARDLKENMTLTVEPGCYFIKHLINEALKEESDFRQFLNEEVLNSFRNFGGVRLEDVIEVTKSGCVNYTICPRTIDEVEAVLSGQNWPPMKDDDPSLMRTRLVQTPSPIFSTTPK